MTFQELGLKNEILSAITKIGFVNPTPIQQQAIPYLLEKQGDLVGLASTGTGKTAAFGLPMLHLIDASSKHTQGLVLCPTRELCIQITNDLQNYSEFLGGVNVVPVYGGTDIVKQIRQIERGAQIVVATPGRLIDLIERKKIKLQTIQYVVLDEADEMLNMGFKEDIDQILTQTPAEKSVWLFSATMPKEVASIAKNYMESPFEITVGGKNEGNKNIEHDYYVVRERDRYEALKRIIDFNPDIYGLIFCRTRMETGKVADKLMAEGYNAEPLHGDLSQAQRDRVMDKFRQRTLQILVATDVAARGIDVTDITHVIHYNLPEDVENYTHRSGRTARAGKKGISIALVNSKEMYKIKAIERIIKSNFAVKSVPSPDQICEIRLMHMVTKIADAPVDANRMNKYMPAVMEKLNHFTNEELVQRFVSGEFNKLLDYYSGSASDLNADGKSDRGSDRNSDRNNRRDRDDRNSDSGSFSKGRRSESSSRNDENFQRFFVNLGRRDGFNQGALLRMVCDNTGMDKSGIGKIDIMNNFSFFDAEKSQTEMILSKLKGTDFEGKEMSIEQTSKGDSRGSGESKGEGRGGSRSFGGGGRSERFGDRKPKKEFGSSYRDRDDSKPKREFGAKRSGGFDDSKPKREYGAKKSGGFDDSKPKREFGGGFKRKEEGAGAGFKSPRRSTSSSSSSSERPRVRRK